MIDVERYALGRRRGRPLVQRGRDDDGPRRLVSPAPLVHGGQLGPTGDWCRAVWRVSGLRRFPVVDGETRDAVILDRTPDPWDVEVESTYVVDLVAADRD